MPSAMLAIELSQRDGSIALRVEGAGGAGGTGSAGGTGGTGGTGGAHLALVTRSVPRSTDDRDELMPTIAALVSECGLVPGDVRTVAVSIGPGGFTGLRVAVATAKALSLGVGSKLIGVPSALAVARASASAHSFGSGRVGVVLATKGDHAWLEVVELLDGVPTARTASNCTAADAPLAGLLALLADEHLPSTWTDRAACEGVRILPAAWSAEACLLEGERLLARHGPTDPSALEPIYPRPPEAVTLWNARRQSAGANSAGGAA